MFKTKVYWCKKGERPFQFAKRWITQVNGHNKHLGSGAYGSVYGRADSPIVFKICDHSSNKGGYLTFVDEIRKLGYHNSYLPRIYGVWHIMPFCSSKVVNRRAIYTVIAMERLKPLHKGEHYDTVYDIDDLFVNSNSISNLNDLCKEISSGARHYKNLIKAFGIRIKDRKALIKKEVADLFKLMINLDKVGCWFDLHDGNFMLRNNQIVVTDPVT